MRWRGRISVCSTWNHNFNTKKLYASELINKLGSDGKEKMRRIKLYNIEKETYKEILTVAHLTNYTHFFYTSMYYSNLDIENLIDTYSVCNLKPTYPWVIITLPFQIDDCVRLDDEPIKVPPPPIIVLSIPISSSLPPLIESSKKRKVLETSTHQMSTINLDDFKFDEVVLKDVMVINTLITYFDEGIFGRLDLIRDLFNHFGSDTKRARVREAHRSERASKGVMMANRLIDVSNKLHDFHPILYCCNT